MRGAAGGAGRCASGLDSWVAALQGWVALPPLALASAGQCRFGAATALYVPSARSPARSGYATSEDGEPYWLVKNIWSPFWVGGWLGGWA